MSSASAGPIMSPTSVFQKLQLVFKVLDQTHPKGYGYINLGDAFKLFGMCRLPQSILMKILEYTENSIDGCLQFSELVQAMHLIYMVQCGHELTSDLLKKAGGPDSFRLPNMEGLDKFLSEEKMKTDVQLQQMDTPTPCHALQLSQLMSPFKRFVSRSSSRKEKTTMETFISGISLSFFAEDMERLYVEKLKPLETEYSFCDFVVPPVLHQTSFVVDPLVMVLGEPATGKTSFVKQMLNSDYPGCKYSNKFYFIKHGIFNENVSVSTLDCSGPNFSSHSLKMCGPNVASCMVGALLKNSVLGYASFVDTPGIRDYHVKISEYRKVILWCAHKCDMILLFFDPHKPEICDEFNWLLSSLHRHEHKFRIVIYKVDDIDPKEMTKAYGSLMLLLGKIVNSSDPFPAYIGF